MKCRQLGSNVAFVHFLFKKCTMLHLIRGWRHFILDHRILCRPKTTFGPRVGSIVALTQCCLCDIGPGDAFPMVSSDELTGQRTHSVECRSTDLCDRSRGMIDLGTSCLPCKHMRFMNSSTTLHYCKLDNNLF